jgi:hypothetical protein
MDEKRVVVAAGFLGDGERGAMGHLVFWTNNKVLESVRALDGWSRRGRGVTGRPRDNDFFIGLRTGIARGGRQTVLHATASDEGQLAAEQVTVVAVHPSFGKHARGFEEKDIALDDADGIQGGDPSIVVGTGENDTELAFCGLPKGIVTEGVGHEERGRVRKVVHRHF